jgi:hypothetical protein
MFFIFPVFSLWLAGYAIAQRSLPLHLVALLLYAPWAIYAGLRCWIAASLLAVMVIFRERATHWTLYGVAVALTLIDWYVKILS